MLLYSTHMTTHIDAPIAEFWKAHAAYKASIVAYLTIKSERPPREAPGYQAWRDRRDAAYAEAQWLYDGMLAAQEAVVAAASGRPTLTLPMVADASGLREWRS